LLACCAVEDPPPRPNVVVILADDLGYGSLAASGGPALRTPNLDRLAREGRRFTQAYAPSPICSPSRYALLTGRYYWRTSLQAGEVLFADAPLHIETTRPTRASLLRDHGYRTAAFGKWHLGLGAERRTDWTAPLAPGPRAVGFERFFGLAANPGSPPHAFIENEAIARPLEARQILRTLSERALSWLESGADRERPFFLYFAADAVHEPIAPHPDFTGSPFGPYGDAIEELDGAVGRLLDALDRLGVTRDTLVIFSSDNGGPVGAVSPEVMRALEAGLAVNGPLRGGKHDIWEGGVRVPFLVRWPGQVPAGTVSPRLVGLIDLFATLAGVLEAPLPEGAAEDSIDVGRSWREAAPGAPVREQVILQDAHGTFAIRHRDWKLVERTELPPIVARNRRFARQIAKARRLAPQHDELFDLAADPGETRDVADEHPEIVAELRRRLSQARSGAGSAALREARAGAFEGDNVGPVRLDF
jgi:arylsulfatase A-like enzyme